MSEQDWLAERYETHPDHLHSVAHGMLGTQSEADGALQEAWIRFIRTDRSDVDNLGGWLTTVASRVCLDMLGARGSRREQSDGPSELASPASHWRGATPKAKRCWPTPSVLRCA